MCHCDPSIRTPCCGSNCHAKMMSEGESECVIHRLLFGRPSEESVKGEDMLTAAAARELAKSGRMKRMEGTLKDALKEIKNAAVKGDSGCGIVFSNPELMNDIIAALKELGFKTTIGSIGGKSASISVSWADEVEPIDPFPVKKAMHTFSTGSMLLSDPMGTKKNFGRCDREDEEFPQY